MAGGLIQIVTYGSQDLFLTGTPEITFFKVVYRRHTNFSIESTKVNFDNPVSFGGTSCLTIPKVGDLVHKTYLQIDLPEIDLKRSDANSDLTSQVEQSEANLQIVTDFMSINRRAYVGAFDLFQAENTTTAEEIIMEVNSVFNESGNVETINNFRDLLTDTIGNPFGYDEVSMQSIAAGFIAADPKEDIFNAMTIGIDKSVKTQNFYFEAFRDLNNQLEDDMNNNIKFAWVDRIGHAIIDQIEIFIGGQKVDRHFGDWLNIWYELAGKRDMEETYFKMIGNIEKLTTFDRTVKPTYRLTVPLQFWFSRFSGLSIPLVALEYHDVKFEVKFRNFEQLCYIENGKQVFIPETEEEVFLDDVPDRLGININACMIMDYIYLDSGERRRFAQSSHEYLIEQLQVLEMVDTTQRNIQCVLNNFVHPAKEIIWVAQKVKYTQNLTGWDQTRWDNYSLTDENSGNPILFSSMNFHSYERVERLDGNYFNYVQPYQHHNATPSDGINMYSFSIFPEEHQPSGSANMSRLSRVVLFLELDQNIFGDDPENPELVNIRIYIRNLNILRIMSGMGGLAYTYS